MMRFVLGALRTAEKPVTSREIADTVMDGRGLNKDDPKVAQLIRKRVIACIMHIAKTKAEWQARASAFLKAEMKEKGVAYVGLVERLEAHGFKETEASITMKLKRGTFAATFLFACLAALEVEGMALAQLAEV